MLKIVNIYKEHLRRSATLNDEVDGTTSDFVRHRPFPLRKDGRYNYVGRITITTLYKAEFQIWKWLPDEGFGCLLT